MSADIAELREGGCRCGRVRFAVSAPPMLTVACHCRGCQRMTSTAFSMSIAFPVEGFAMTRGETVIGGLHGATEHHHCGYCLSWLFTRIEGQDRFVNVRTTMLDEPPREPPFVEVWRQEALPWAVTGATHSYPAGPEPDEYMRLVAAFQAKRLGGGA